MNARPGNRLVQSIFWSALSLWFAFLVAAGVTATFNFVVLPDLQVSLGEFSEFKPGNHEEQGRLAAGMVLEKVFTLSDYAQVVMGSLTAMSLVLIVIVYGAPLRRVANLLRVSCVGLALVCAGYHVFLQAPVMNRELRAYWDAARAGDVAAAEAHQAQFEQFHPRASAMLQINAGLVFVTIIASACASVPRAANRRAGAVVLELEKPALAS